MRQQSETLLFNTEAAALDWQAYILRTYPPEGYGTRCSLTVDPDGKSELFVRRWSSCD